MAMDSKEFKKLFGEIAEKNGFSFEYGGWLKESNECIVVLDLQKSNFGNYYQLNIKIFVQGLLGNTYQKNKHLIKNANGNFDLGEPKQYRPFFSLEEPIEDTERKQKLEELFSNYLMPLANKALTFSGVKELALSNQLPLGPAYKKELGW
ncbi:MAG: hypothetical protein JWQ09_5510 [Segetibacter sp.]|nr:hypothetical protein [Segetibacter sp.]